AFRDARRTVTLLAAAMSSAEFDAARLEAVAGGGWSTLTELADTLARDHGLPFRLAHGIARGLVVARQQDPHRPTCDLRADVPGRMPPAPIVYAADALDRILSPRHFVDVRRTFGGPAPAETVSAASASKRQLESDRDWLRQRLEGLSEARSSLTA